ncbi:MAG: gliding motility protein GldL [Saprospiraceae bacterium]|nr:gliding motility protein GldL [Candidatus Opimibacter iunctus]
MNRFIKSSSFKYLKNAIIGFGASIVMIGALGKIRSAPWGDAAITAGLLTEAFLFFMLGIIPPEKDYYWEKLYPGLEKYNSKIAPLTAGEVDKDQRPLNGAKVENQLGGMLSELQIMAKSMSSLKALQEVDFSQTSEQIKSMGNFYDRMNQAMVELSHSVEETKAYRSHISALNQNIQGVSQMYQGVLASKEQLAHMNAALTQLASSEADAKGYTDQMATLNKNLRSLNSVYGNVLTAMTGGKA